MLTILTPLFDLRVTASQCLRTMFCTKKGFKELLSNPKNRNYETLEKILAFLKETRIMRKLEEDSKVSSFEMLLHFVAANIKFIMVPAKKILFKTGDPGDRLFIIASGSVSLFKPVEMVKEMNLEQYFKLLLAKRTRNDLYSANKTIELNKKIIDLDLRDAGEYDKILFTVKNHKKLTSEPSMREITEIFSEAPLSLYDCYIDEQKEFESEEEKLIFYQKAFESYFCKGVPMYYINNYSAVAKEEAKFKFVVIEEDFFLQMNKFDYFGDYSLGSSDNLRKATVITKEDCIFGVLSKDIYMEHIHAESHKKKMREIGLLVENYFFSSVAKSFFEKKYFGQLLFKEFTRGEKVVDQESAVDMVYFIREGEIEVSMYGSILSLMQLGTAIVNRAKLDLNVPSFGNCALLSRQQVNFADFKPK